MSPPLLHLAAPPLLALLLLPLLLAASSPLSTFSVSRVSNQTLVCALASVPSTGAGYTLNCTTLPRRQYEAYDPPSASSYYTGVAAGDGFLCGLLAWKGARGRTAMMWWKLDGAETTLAARRLYYGDPLERLVAGDSRVCGLVAGKINCWPRWRGLPDMGGFNFSELAVGRGFVCGLVSESGEVRCSGDESSGVVGCEPSGSHRAVAAGTAHACAVSTANATLVCWGLGSQTVPAEVGGSDVGSLALGTNRTCVLRSSNETVVCWGQGDFALPAALRRESFLAVETKHDVFCGLRKSDYSLVCWGNGDVVADPTSPVFARVLPGSCVDQSDCPCNFIDGSGGDCPYGLVICKPCPPPPLPPPLPSTLPPSPRLPPSTKPITDNVQHAGGGEHDRHRKRRTVYMIVGSVGCGVALMSIISFVFWKWWRGQWKCARVHDSGPLCDEGQPSSRPTEMLELRHKPPVASGIDQRLSKLLTMGHSSTIEEFPLAVLAAATMSFSDEMKIGSGSFGSVYRAVLGDGREVAIKRAGMPPSPSGKRAAGCHRCHDKANAFVAELALLSRVHHKNLVRLLGFCREENELVLVYDYMANGTLHDHLHGGRLNSPLSSWTTRIKAALDGARGVEYLHQYAVPPIIHRDIKSSNILLDDQWTAKVADFGLCLVGPDDEADHLSLRAAGTVGYMDPEYYRLQSLTTKSDVYSFGVVLLELLTGRRAIHRDEADAPRNVVDYAVPHIAREDLEAVLDPMVPPPKPCEIEAVQLVGYLAEDCVKRDRRERPDMSDVVYQLEVALALCEVEPPPPPPPTQPAVVRSMTVHSV